MLALRQSRYTWLRRAGFTHKESLEFSRAYGMEQLRHLSYLERMVQWRRLYVSNLRRAGYDDDAIRRSVTYVYYKNSWTSKEGTPDMWAMLRQFRQAAIEIGDYIPPQRKGSHHKAGISKGDVIAQKLRRRLKDKTRSHPAYDRPSEGTVKGTLAKIADLNNQIQAEPDEGKKRALTERRNKLWKAIS